MNHRRSRGREPTPSASIVATARSASGRVIGCTGFTPAHPRGGTCGESGRRRSSCSCSCSWRWPPTWRSQSSTNGLIVFRSDRDGEPDLFTLDVVTGATTKLTNSAGFAELQPAWSPDGGRILYVRRARLSGRPDLFVMNANGRGRTRLTSTSVPERDPSWSPDGTALVYAARTAPGEPFRIFVARADGSGRQQLTSQKAGSDRAPVWSPDGTRIAFVSDRDGDSPSSI